MGWADRRVPQRLFRTIGRCLLIAGLWMASPALANVPAAVTSVDAQINAIYERIAAAARDRDPLLSRRAYAPEAVFLDERRAAIQIGPDLHESMRASIDDLRRDGADARISYRVIRRTVRGNHAIDTGYYRVSVAPADGGSPPSVTYRKFLLTAEPRDDGTWHITSDASLPSSHDAYQGAQSVFGLKFDP